jgi:hypothetical protein
MFWDCHAWRGVSKNAHACRQSSECRRNGGRQSGGNRCSASRPVLSRKRHTHDACQEASASEPADVMLCRRALCTSFLARTASALIVFVDAAVADGRHVRSIYAPQDDSRPAVYPFASGGSLSAPPTPQSGQRPRFATDMAVRMACIRPAVPRAGTRLLCCCRRVIPRALK